MFIITACEASKGYVFTRVCHSVHSNVTPPDVTPPKRQSTREYSMHLTGIHTCFAGCLDFSHIGYGENKAKNKIRPSSFHNISRFNITTDVEWRTIFSVHPCAHDNLKVLSRGRFGILQGWKHQHMILPNNTLFHKKHCMKLRKIEPCGTCTRVPILGSTTA